MEKSGLDTKHAAIVLDLLNKQRKNGKEGFCDVTLLPRKDPLKEMKVHKCLLSLNPNVYRLLKPRDNVSGDSEWYAELDVSYDTLANILDFMYTGNCHFNQQNVIETIQSAAMLGMERLRCKAKDFLDEVTMGIAQPPVVKNFPQNDLTQSLAQRYPWLTGGILHLASKSQIISTFEFLPACQMCAIPAGDQTSFFRNQIPNHESSCYKDILLAKKMKTNGKWKRIRNVPYQSMKNENNTVSGQFQICKEIEDGNECSYGNNCTFAQSPEELEVWTAEKRGDFMRHWIMGNLNGLDVQVYLKALVNRYGGSFKFQNLSVDPAKPKRQLIHEKSVRIRDSRNCRMEICWHENKETGSCKLGETCHFSHSDLELEVWILLRSTNLSAQQLVQFSQSGNTTISKRKAEIMKEMNEIEVPPIDQLLKNIIYLCSKITI